MWSLLFVTGTIAAAAAYVRFPSFRAGLQRAHASLMGLSKAGVSCLSTPCLLGAILLVTLFTSLALLSAAAQAHSTLSFLSELARTDLGTTFEYKLPRSALLAVHDAYAGAVASAGRLHQINVETGEFTQTGWDVSMNLEFSVIWSRMLARGYLKNTTSPHQRLVVDVGAM